jgi:hypothetical protein
MKTVIYLDILLAVNFVVAAFLLAGCSAVCGADCRVGRTLLGSAAAAASSLILLAPELPFILQLVYQAATAALVVRAAFRWQGVRTFLRQCMWYLLLNLTLAGLVVLAAYRGCNFVQTNNLACYYGISPLLLFGCVAGVYLFLRLLVYCFGRPAGQRLWQMQLWTDGAQFTVPAYYDTGFGVKDPLSGRPAVLVYYSAVQAQLPPGLCAYLDAYFSVARAQMPLPPPGLHICLIECRTVAGTALLPAVPAARYCLRQGRAVLHGEDIRIVFTGEKVPDTRCPALFGPELAHCGEWRKNHDDTAATANAAK